MKKWKWVAFFGITTCIAYFLWKSFQLPAGLEAKGTDKVITEITYYTAIASGIAGFFSLLKEVISLIREAMKR